MSPPLGEPAVALLDERAEDEEDGAAMTAAPATPAGHAFIAYSRRDADFVLDLAERLRERGQPVWLDQWNERPGDDWDRSVDEAIRSCAAFLIVLSPDAVASEEVRGELRAALNRRKRIVPLLYRPCDVPRQIQNTQYLDLTDSEMTDAVADDLAAALGQRPAPHGGRWKDARRAWGPVGYLGGRLKAIGAAAGGGLVLLAVSGLLAEASYARLLGIAMPRSAPAVLYSGLQFFITLLVEALVITLPAGLAILLGYALAHAAGRWAAAAAAVERTRRALSRPGLLWSAQLVAYVLLFFFSLTVFADLLPLDEVVGEQLKGPRFSPDGAAGLHYRAAVLHAAAAGFVVVGLEAWRRRLHRVRRHMPRSEALVSLGLALPLYLLVCVELLLVPIGHGLLKLPARREYSGSVVTFRSGARNAELRGKSLFLVSLGGTDPYSFYCPMGPKVWEAEKEDVESFARATRGTLASLVETFHPQADCQVSGAAPEEVAR
jgi:hypothetical protein